MGLLGRVAFRRTAALAAAAVLAVALGGLITPTAAAFTMSGSTTAYHACDGSGSTTAWGTKVGPKRRDRYFPGGWGVVASNDLAMGTWVETRSPRSVGGRRFFRVEDTGGPGFMLDFYAKSCGWMSQWGRRTITVRVLSRRDLWHGLPKAGWWWRCCWSRPRWFA